MRSWRSAEIWVARAAWSTLPLSAGTGAAGAIEATFGRATDATSVTASVLCWLAWGTGALALLAPRPVGLTALRAIAPVALVLAVVAVADGATDGLAAVGLLVGLAVAYVLVADPALGRQAADAVAYGDERRFPLRTPPALFLGPLPAVRALVAAGVVAPPLLLADGRVVAGAVASVAAAVVLPIGARALHGLSRRWLVLVPAGVVVADPLTLADPTLFTRDHVRAVRPVAADGSKRPGSLDLRLGAALGSLEIVLDEEAELLRAGVGRRGGRVVRADTLVIAVGARAELLEAAANRRLPIQAV